MVYLSTENLDMNLSPDEIDLSTKVESKRLYTNNTYNEETIAHIRDERFYKKHGYYKGQEPWLKDPMDSLDYSLIENEEYRISFINLCKDFEKSKIKRTFGTDVNCYAWYSWVESTQQKFGYTFRTLYVQYGTNHYADKFEKGSYIFDVNDYSIKDKNGKVTRYNDDSCYAMMQFESNANVERGHKKQGVTSIEICRQYCRLFQWILYGHKELTFEKLLWHVMKFMQMTVSIKQCGCTPRNVYDMVRLTMEESKTSFRLPSKNSTGNFNMEHCKRYYIEPGYEKETTVKLVNRDLRKQYIALAFKACKNKGLECNYDNITEQFILVGGKVKKSNNGKKSANIIKKLGNYVTDYFRETDEFMKAYYSEVCDRLKHNLGNVVARISRKELKELIEEMKHETEYKDTIGDGLVNKTYKKGSERKPHKEYKQGSERKQQDRTLWKSLVDLNVSSNDNYEEIIKSYPNVTKNAYNICRSRLKKQLNN